jgi:hypothetical protein
MTDNQPKLTPEQLQEAKCYMKMFYKAMKEYRHSRSIANY